MIEEKTPGPPQRFDVELSLSDAQVLSSADAVAAFFARLGYNTDARTPQTPANLGMTAEGTIRPIKKIELIADQENLFQVYLFDLTNVTITHTRALARVFRNRAGNYLLVLTSDYERLDFVLLEKYLPAESDDSSTIAQKQIGVRPRVLTVNRRGRDIHLRVLRRFTWTESDPFAQYDKLLSAYAVADWSEEFFNNRTLFSDYYLLKRFRERPEWTVRALSSWNGSASAMLLPLITTSTNIRGSAGCLVESIEMKRRFIKSKSVASAPEESHRLQEGLARVMKPEFIPQWLHTPNEAFEGLKPLEVIEHGQIDRIWRMIFYLESGMPT